MLLQIVLYLTFTVYFVSAVCDQRCHQQYTRVKRGKFHSNPPMKFYNLPPFPIPVNGPYSNTPPPFMVDYEPHYAGSRPYKVSKIPLEFTSHNHDGLGDDDITNLVKHLSKQDLDKILEFAQEKDQGFNKYNDIYNTNNYNRPFKRESKIIYKGNIRTKYEEPQIKTVNYVTEPIYSKVYPTQENPKPIWTSSGSVHPFDSEKFAQNPRVPIEDENTVLKYINDQIPDSFFGSINQPAYLNVYSERESPKPITQVKTENVPLYDTKGTDSFAISTNPYFTETNEEDKLLPPFNMREDDSIVSNTNNVAKVVKADASSYDIKNFGDLPLMDYTQFQLNDVSSYHVPHYTVTQSRPSKSDGGGAAAPPPSAPVPSYSSGAAYSPSSSLLKPSPASASIKAPVYEPAPPISAASEQSDAHLKVVKIWTHKSKGAAYTLHDDGTLSPERSRPKYG